MAQFIPLILTVASGVMSAVQQRNAGIAAEQQYKAEAKQEKDAARQKELDKRRDLLRALSSQSAIAGSQLVAFSGGKAAIAQRDITEAATDLLVDRVNSGRKIAMFQSAGRNARQQGNLGAIGSLLDTAGGALKQYPGKKAA